MMSDILNKILAAKALEVTNRSRHTPLHELNRRCDSCPPTRGFSATLSQRIAADRPAVICEVKKASPSKGIIREQFNPAEIAVSYATGGAACISVLTDEQFFQGRDEHLAEVKRACSLPVIRKDFIVHPYQIYESRAIGADAILLIVSALDDPALHQLSALALEVGLDILVEVHNQGELSRALSLPDGLLLGINNRNLHTFETTLETTLSMLDQIPDNRIVVAESGIQTKADIDLMRRHGISAFLIGEALMRAQDPGKKLQELLGEDR